MKSKDSWLTQKFNFHAQLFKYKAILFIQIRKQKLFIIRKFSIEAAL